MSAQELRHEHVLNPALGLRAIRWSLSEPGMFRQQLRAILRASAYGSVRILIPMVAHLREVTLIARGSGAGAPATRRRRTFVYGRSNWAR